MSLVFGEIKQIAYVTREFDKVLDFFLASGIGPWFVSKQRMMRNVNYMGNKVDIEMSVGVANSGSLQIEVIAQTNSVRSFYSDWLEKHPTELLVQHVSSWPVDFAGTEKKVFAAGYKELMSAQLGHGAFGYYHHPARPEFIFEMSELTTERRFVWDTAAKGAVGWDGKDPLRPWPVYKPA